MLHRWGCWPSSRRAVHRGGGHARQDHHLRHGRLPCWKPAWTPPSRWAVRWRPRRAPGPGPWPWVVAEACESDGTFPRYRPGGRADQRGAGAPGASGRGRSKPSRTHLPAISRQASSRAASIRAGADDRPPRRGRRPGRRRDRGAGGPARGLRLRRRRRLRRGGELLPPGDGIPTTGAPGTVSLGRGTPVDPGRHNVPTLWRLANQVMTAGVPSPGRRSLAGSPTPGGGSRCWRGAGHPVVDDYAHHPTEIRAMLAAAREQGGAGRVVAVFQPQRYTRTHGLWDGFATALSRRRRRCPTKIYSRQARADPRRVGPRLWPSDRRRTPACRCGALPNTADLPTCWRNGCPGDMVVTMGAGDIWKVAHELAAALKARVRGHRRVVIRVHQLPVAGDDLLHVVPHIPLLRGIPEQRRGVVGGHEVDALPLDPLAAHAGDAPLRGLMIPCRAVAPRRTTIFGRTSRICARGWASRPLARPGRARVAGRPALDDVGDIAVPLPVEAGDLQDAVQQLAGPADEGRPSRSSSAPGPSPMHMSPAGQTPSPKTTCVQPARSPQRLQPFTASSRASMVGMRSSSVGSPV